jgi:hypothetical protein
MNNLAAGRVVASGRRPAIHQGNGNGNGNGDVCQR